MQSRIREVIERSAQVKSQMAADSKLIQLIEKAAIQLQKTIAAGGTIYSCGNGGSACDAMHFTEELIARFKRDRPGIKAMHMLDSSTMTCWSNDYSYETLFERYVLTFCGPADTVLAISTSGNSANILKALDACKRKGAFSIGLGGKDGGLLKEKSDLALIVPATETERIQEGHILIIHALCELID